MSFDVHETRNHPAWARSCWTEGGNRPDLAESKEGYRRQLTDLHDTVPLQLEAHSERSRRNLVEEIPAMSQPEIPKKCKAGVVVNPGPDFHLEVQEVDVPEPGRVAMSHAVWSQQADLD